YFMSVFWKLGSKSFAARIKKKPQKIDNKKTEYYNK
ncbi:unnamed protein product, partial [marine sediment metagenome]